jgi:polysaccharide export outer membrane protein
MARTALIPRRASNPLTRSVWAALGMTLFLAAHGSASAARSREFKADACPVPTDRGSDYRLSTGDTLQIFVWRNPELSVTVPIRPDGRISTPLVEDMAAAGKTPSELAADLEVVLEEFIRTPEVNVIVGAQGPANQIQVVGQVVNPQALAFREGLRLLDALVSVGGLTDFAAGNRTKLAREIDGAQVECAIRASALLAGDLSQNVPVFPGDVIVVPETRL